MVNSNIKVSLIISLIIGLLLIGIGITGNVIYNGSSLRDQCNSDRDCVTGKICCFVHNGEGTCQDKESCDNIMSALKNEESPLKNNYSIYSINLGLGIVAIVASILYTIYFIESKDKRKNKKRK